MSPWLRIRSISRSIQQTPLALVYLLPLVTCGLLLVVVARSPALRAAMTWKALLVSVYWGAVAIWISFGPLTRSRWFDPGLLAFQLIGAGLLGLILGAIFRPAPSLMAGHALVCSSLFPSLGWSGFTCTAPGCLRLFRLVEVIREGEPYQSYCLDSEGRAVVVRTARMRNLRVCAVCGEGTRAHQWTRDPAKFWRMVGDKAKELADPKARALFWGFVAIPWLLLCLLLWLLARLWSWGAQLMPRR